MPTGKPPRFEFLDGLRGLAAFYVMLFHVLADGQATLSTDRFLLNFFRFGSEAVVVFIALSGFVNALPVARSTELSLPGGVGGFLGRRARRLLPGYYAALFLLPLYSATMTLAQYAIGKGADWSRVWEMVFNADMLSHLVFLHNLSQEWILSINPPLWTMSTLVWIYVLFALVLWPVWKSFGVYSATFVSILLGLLPTVIGSLGGPVLHGSPHLLVAFGLGMASAAHLFASKGISQNLAKRRVISGVAIVSFILFILCEWVQISSRAENAYLQFSKDSCIALFSTTWIYMNACSVRTGRWIWSPAKTITRLLESRPLVFLGKISYSLYVTHVAVWWAIWTSWSAWVKQRPGWSPDALPARLLMVPILLASAYGFYTLFEKPFLPRRTAARQASSV